MKTIDVTVEDYGTIHLEDHGGFYYVTDNNNQFIGEIDPNDFERWSADEHILASILEDLIDDGTLEMPSLLE